MEIFLVIVFCILVAIVALINFYIDIHFSKKSLKKIVEQQAEMAAKAETDTKIARCPVCSEPLLFGQKLRAIVYTGREQGKSCTILGCPKCYPHKQDGVSRECPVCKESLSADDYLIAQIYEKNGRNDVNVIGCSICRPESDPSRRNLGNFPTKSQIDSLKSERVF